MSFLLRWRELKPEDQCQLFHAYSTHFPIDIRFAFADWIDSKPWFDLDINNSRDRQSVDNLISCLLNEIESRANYDQKFVSIAEKVQKYRIQPYLLFDSIKQCLIIESEIFPNSTHVCIHSNHFLI